MTGLPPASTERHTVLATLTDTVLYYSKEVSPYSTRVSTPTRTSTSKAYECTTVREYLYDDSSTASNRLANFTK